ncbi:MAG: hypothetical protein H3C54_13745 [Taibaiella sp.]|nr:hypothetical protein [Taibaiella sp.]
MSMTLAEYEAYLRTLAERVENIEPQQQKLTKPAKKKRLIKKQFHHKKQ